jgi:rhodanese-related sulfurtransferase
MKSFIITSAVVLCITAAPLAFSEEAAKPPKWMSTPVKELVDRARASTKQVSINDLKDAIERKEDMVILDVRNLDEYDVAHIPNAVNVPRGLLEFNIWTAVPDTDKKLYVYCKTGARAALATKQLNELGYKNAVAINVGAAAWAEAGNPVQTSIAAVKGEEKTSAVAAKRLAGQ